MKNSGSSSATSTSPPPATPPRDSIALTGPSVALDPRIHAVRADLADVRLANRIFAPHYAAPLSCVVGVRSPLRAEPSGESEILAELAPGGVFEVLELGGSHAWGTAVEPGLVGYVDRAALGARSG